MSILRRALKIDIDVRVCQKKFDNFNMTVSGSRVQGRGVAILFGPVHIDLRMVPQDR